VIGIDPGPYTLRQLVWMAEGLDQQQWRHTSSLCAILANVNRPSKRRAYKPDDFNPYSGKARSQPGAIEVTPETVGQFREAFIGPKQGH